MRETEKQILRQAKKLYRNKVTYKTIIDEICWEGSGVRTARRCDPAGDRKPGRRWALHLRRVETGSRAHELHECLGPSARPRTDKGIRNLRQQKHLHCDGVTRVAGT